MMCSGISEPIDEIRIWEDIFNGNGMSVENERLKAVAKEIIDSYRPVAKLFENFEQGKYGSKPDSYMSTSAEGQASKEFANVIGMGTLKSHLEIIKKTLDDVWSNDRVFFVAVPMGKN